MRTPPIPGVLADSSVATLCNVKEHEGRKKGERHTRMHAAKGSYSIPQFFELSFFFLSFFFLGRSTFQNFPVSSSETRH